jgi:hypothetical protein
MAFDGSILKVLVAVVNKFCIDQLKKFVSIWPHLYLLKRMTKFIF